MNPALIRFAFAAQVLSVAACHKKEETGRARRRHTRPVAATIVTVAPQAFTETLGAIGTVVSRAGHAATLSAPAAGLVSKILVTGGQTVRAGQTLVELDQAPFQAAVQSANAALAVAERANERQQRLAQEGIIPRKMPSRPRPKSPRLAPTRLPRRALRICRFFGRRSTVS
jgi:membrane fusion protein (multidrug efflux system)